MFFRVTHHGFNLPNSYRTRSADLQSTMHRDLRPTPLLSSCSIHIQSFTSNAGRFERQCDVAVGLFVRNTDSEFPPLFVPAMRASAELNECIHRHITRG
jgi:hypothetical protein